MNNTDTFPVEYKINMWDEFVGKSKTVYGVTLAKSYTEAMDNIEKYYGDSIIEISLYPLENNSVYEFNWDEDDNPYLSEWLKDHFPRASAC